jgi:hypothetical protein
MIGECSAVRLRCRQRKNLEEAKGMVARTVVIPSPHPDMLQSIILIGTQQQGEEIWKSRHSD